MTDVGPASVQYDDWTGSFAADDWQGLVDFHSEFGIPDNYWVVGFNMSYYEGGHGLHIYGVDRSIVPDYESLVKRARSHGGVVEVVRFDGTGARVDDVLKLFKRMEVTALHNHAIVENGFTLRVSEEQDLGRESPLDDE